MRFFILDNKFMHFIVLGIQPFLGPLKNNATGIAKIDNVQILEVLLWIFNYSEGWAANLFT